MEENKVILSLKDYIEMLDKIKELNLSLENRNVNYERLCEYIKEQTRSSEDYHLRNIITDKDFEIEKSLNVKLKNYHYDKLAEDFIKIGITFDLIEQLTDELIKEYIEDKEGEENE